VDGEAPGNETGAGPTETIGNDMAYFPRSSDFCTRSRMRPMALRFA
jgi:hypothetical protein